MSDTNTSGRYRVNGHEFEVLNTIGDSQLVRCEECLVREVISDDEDHDEYLDLMTPECHIEWLRQPDGGFRGVALRNASGFQGRDLIAVDSDGDVTDTVRIYDDDRHQLASILDLSEWNRRSLHTGNDQEDADER